MKKFIRGCFCLQFKDYSNDKYDDLIMPEWPKVNAFCESFSIAGEMYDTEDQKVYFEYKVVRNTIKECRAVRTIIKGKLKEIYGVKVVETMCAEGECF